MANTRKPSTRSSGDLRNPYRVFVSSTYIDNKERRKHVLEAINDAEMISIGMERFTAATRPTVEECLRHVQEADLLIGIIGHRYGWIPENGDKSITEMEYDKAKERLMFLLNEDLPVLLYKDTDPPGPENKQYKLYLFKEKIKRDQLPAVFDENTLQSMVYRALQEWRTKRERC